MFLHWVVKSVRMVRMNMLGTAEVVRMMGMRRVINAGAHRWNRMVRQRMDGRHVDIERIAVRFDGIIQRRHLCHHRRVFVAKRTRRHHVGATVINPLLSRLFTFQINQHQMKWLNNKSFNNL